MSHTMYGAVVLNRELPRRADVAGTVGPRNNDRRRPLRLLRPHRQRMIQNALIRIVQLYS